MQCVSCDAEVDAPWLPCPGCGGPVILNSTRVDEPTLMVVDDAPCARCGEVGGLGYVYGENHVVDGRHLRITGPCPECHPAGAALTV